MRGGLLVKIFLGSLSLLAIANGIDELKKLPTLLLPASAFARINGQVLGVMMKVDHTPGHAESVGTTRRLYAVEFSYRAGQVSRRGNALSPICSYCERNDVVRITGRHPEALNKGTPVTVYVRTSQPEQAFLELPRNEDIRHQVLWTLLWLVGFPIFAYLLSKAWDHATPTTD